MSGVPVNIKAEIKDATRFLSRLEKKAVPRAAAQALNRTAKAVNTQVVRAISNETNIKPQRKVRSAISLYKASGLRLEAKLRAWPRRINLVEFVAPSQRQPGAFRKRPGVRAKAWGQSKVYEGSFLGRGRNSGKVLVFARKGQQQYPIKALHGPSIPRTFVQNNMMEIMHRTTRERFRKEFDRALKFGLRRYR